MRYKYFQRVLVLLLSLMFYSNLVAQQYSPSSDVIQKSWSDGTWKGKHKFSNVYCLSFPNPEVAINLTKQLFNNNAIHMTRVTYPNRMMINIVASTRPAHITPSEEYKKIYNLERYAEETYQHDYNIVQTEGAFGPVIGLQIKDVAPAGKDDPYPLVRPIYKPAKKPIESMSIHKLFVRGPDRFEIAIYQSAPENAVDSTEKIMTDSLIEISRQTLKSFEECTFKLPIRPREELYASRR
tara:strand:- start:6520 stop:7236 length:717 start_codon:yes stop_codon:yes gene_type:complete